MLDQVAEQRIGEPILVRPLGVAEDAVERLRVGLLDLAHRLLQRLADVGRDRAHIVPVAALGNLEAVVLREERVLLVAAGLRQRRGVLLVVHVGDALEEQQREDVGLEVGGIDRAAQDVGGLPEMGFELAEGGCVVRHWMTRAASPIAPSAVSLRGNR